MENCPECSETVTNHVNKIRQRLISIETRVEHLEGDVRHLEKDLKSHEERSIISETKVEASIKALHHRMDSQEATNEKIVDSLGSLNTTVLKIAEVVTRTKEETDANTTWVRWAQKHINRIVWTVAGAGLITSMFYWLYHEGFLILELVSKNVEAVEHETP